MPINYAAWTAVPAAGSEFLRSYQAAKEAAKKSAYEEPTELASEFGIKNVPPGYKVSKKFLDEYMLRGAGGLGGLGMGRGSALLMRGLLTAGESNRLDSLQSAVPLHNQITDAIVALQKGDLTFGQAMIQNYLSRYPNISAFFQNYRMNPTSAASLYDALTRMGAIEQYKLQLGSQAMPTEEAIRHNQLLYPTLGEIKQRSPNVVGKMNAITETLIMSAVQGPLERLSLFRDPETGQFFSPYHENLVKSLTSMAEGLRGKLRYIPGYEVDPHAQMVIPGLTQEAPGPEQAPLPLPPAQAQGLFETMMPPIPPEPDPERARLEAYRALAAKKRTAARPPSLPPLPQQLPSLPAGGPPPLPPLGLTPPELP